VLDAAVCQPQLHVGVRWLRVFRISRWVIASTASRRWSALGETAVGRNPAAGQLSAERGSAGESRR